MLSHKTISLNTILLFFLTLPVMAVQVERVINFSQEPAFKPTSPAQLNDHWSLIHGKIINSDTSRNGLTLSLQGLPSEMLYSFYPPRYKYSRLEFDDFYAKLQVKLQQKNLTISWGIIDSQKNAIMLEYDPTGKQARIISSGNGKQNNGVWRKDIPDSPGTTIQLVRSGGKVFFSCNKTFVGAWQGSFPKYVDFGLKVAGTQPQARITLEKLTISPMPDKAVYSEMLPRPGKPSSARIPQEYQNVGGGIDNGYLWGKHDRPEIALKLDNYRDEAKSYILKIRIMDWLDQPVKSWRREIKLAPEESRIEKIPLPHEQFGFFTLETQLCSTAGNPVEAPRIAGYGITAAENPRELSDQSIIGIHGNPFSRLGIKWVRFHDNGVGTYWPGIEPEKGKWQWGYLESYVSKAEARGMKVLAVLGFTPKWASSDTSRTTYMGKGAYAPAKDLADWENYCRKTVRRLKGHVRYYEIWNEPNNNKLAPRGFFFHGSVEQYYEVLKAAYKAVKEEDPDAVVLAPSGTGSFFAFLDRLLELGGGKYFDVLSIHTYCTPLPPEIGYHFNTEKSYLHRLNRSRNIMKKYNCLKPVWNTEIGYHSGINTRHYGRFLTQDDITEEALPAYWPNWKRGWPFRPLAAPRITAFMVRFALLSLVFDVQKCFIHHKLCDVSGNAYMPAPAIAWFCKLFDSAAFDQTYENKDQLQIQGFKLKNGKYCVAAWLVEKETLMMKESLDRQIAGLDSAPLQDAAQKDISFKNSDKNDTARKYFPATRTGVGITISSTPDYLYDIWGNKLKTTASLTLKEAPVYMVFDRKPENLRIKKNYFQYHDKSQVQNTGHFQGEIMHAPVKPPAVNDLNKVVKLININLKNTALTDGTFFSGKNWLALSRKKGVIFKPGAKAPASGRIVFFLRASSKPEAGFSFKYTLTGDGKEIPLSQWQRFPNKVLMKGKGWTLTCGYLITPILSLKKIKQFILTSSRSQSHIIKIGILPEKN